MSNRKPEYEIRHFGRVKVYPDGTRDIMVSDRPVFREPGWEEVAERAQFERNSNSCSNSVENAERAQRRTRAAIREIALADPFEYFVTLTLDPSKIDRYDMTVITSKLNRWLDNQVRRKGLAYVLVPERHKDGAIHFHGFFNNALEALPSGHYDKQGNEIYNLPGWGLGFSTAIRIYGEYSKAIGYVQKYIGKQGEKPGGRWYYSGGDLKRAKVEYVLLDLEDAPSDAYRFTVAATGAAFAMWTEKD